MPDLEKWIQEQLDSGYSQQQILQSLLDSGYSEQKARSTLQKVLNQRKSQTKPMLSQHKGLISLLIILLIISTAVAYLYQDFRNKSGYNFPDRLGEFELKNKTVENSTENSKISYSCVSLRKDIPIDKRYKLAYVGVQKFIEVGFFLPQNKGELEKCFKNLNDSHGIKYDMGYKEIVDIKGETAIFFDLKGENEKYFRGFQYLSEDGLVVLESISEKKENLLEEGKLEEMILEFAGDIK